MSNDKIEIGLHDKMELYHRSSYIEIVRIWFGRKVIFMTAFAIFWDGFLFMWYSKVDEWTNPMGFYYFPLIHVAVGIGLTYYVVAGWLNRTHILIGQGKIAVRHRPVPWIGEKTLEAADLRQLYAKDKVSHSRNDTSVTYEVRAVTRSGRNIELVSGLESSEQAVYIEQEIEKYLNIEDIPIKGEFGR